MKYKNIFWGILLVAIGVLWLLQNQHIVCIEWKDVWMLWPFILVWIGIGIIPVKDIYKIILDVIVLAIAVVILLFAKNEPDRNDFSLMKLQNLSQTSILNDSNDYQTVHLSMDLAAGKFRINPGKELVNVFGNRLNEKDIILTQDKDVKNRHAEIKLDFKNFINNSANRNYEIQLDTIPIWDIELSMGAADCEFDLSAFKVKKMEIGAGASQIQIKFGDLYPDVELEIETGMASTQIEIPRSMQCTITNESGLSDLDVNGFKKSVKGVYVSENQNDSIKGSIRIHIESGMSNINIIRY